MMLPKLQGLSLSPHLGSKLVKQEKRYLTLAAQLMQTG